MHVRLPAEHAAASLEAEYTADVSSSCFITLAKMNLELLARCASAGAACMHAQQSIHVRRMHVCELVHSRHAGAGGTQRPGGAAYLRATRRWRGTTWRRTTLTCHLTSSSHTCSTLQAMKPARLPLFLSLELPFPTSVCQMQHGSVQCLKAPCKRLSCSRNTICILVSHGSVGALSGRAVMSRPWSPSTCVHTRLPSCYFFAAPAPMPRLASSASTKTTARTCTVERHADAPSMQACF